MALSAKEIEAIFASDFKWLSSLRVNDDVEYFTGSNWLRARITKIKSTIITLAQTSLSLDKEKYILTFIVNVEMPAIDRIKWNDSRERFEDKPSIKKLLCIPNKLQISPLGTHLLKLNYIQHEWELRDKLNRYPVSEMIKLSDPIYYKDKQTNNEFVIVGDHNGLYQFNITQNMKMSKISQDIFFQKIPIFIDNGDGFDLCKLEILDGNILKSFNGKTIDFSFLMENTLFAEAKIIQKVFLINGQYHIFAIYQDQHESKTIHYKYCVETEKMTKVRSISMATRYVFEQGKIPKLMKIFYVRKLNKFIAIDPHIGITRNNGDYIKKIYFCDIKNNHKWSMKKVSLNFNKNMGNYECNGCVICHDTIMMLLCNIGVFAINLVTMEACNINQQSFGHELCVKKGFPTRSSDNSCPEMMIIRNSKDPKGKMRELTANWEECWELKKLYDKKEEIRKSKLRLLCPGKIDLIVNEKENKLYGFHFGMFEHARTDFFHFELDLFDLIPNEFLFKSQLIIYGYCRRMERKNKTIVIPLTLKCFIQAFYSEYAAKHFFKIIFKQ